MTIMVFYAELRVVIQSYAHKANLWTSILEHFFFMKYKNISEGHGRSFHDYVLVFFNYKW
jgi:hypothetical protein